MLIHFIINIRSQPYHFFFGGGGGGVVALPAGFGGGGGGAVFPAAGLGGGGGGAVFPAAGLGGGGGGAVFPAGAGFGGALVSGLGALSAFFGSSFPAGFLASLGASLASFPPATGFFASFDESFFGSAGLARSAGLASSADLAPSAGLASVGGASLGFLPPFPALTYVLSGRISVTTPAAIVLPPSLRANLDPLVMVNGKCNFALIEILSLGLAILVFSGSSISTAVSAVL